MTAGLGAYLRQHRTGRGMTLGQVAASAQVSRRTLMRWEAGATLPRLPELEAVLKALGVTASQRRHALAMIEAPRAVLRLREESQQDSVGEELGTLPLGGDLLRAMRLRRGRTLEEVALSIGVHASAISRWERSEMWPERDSLHALCYTLGAREEELTVLLQGRFLLAESRRQAIKELEQRIAQFRIPPDTPQRLALMDLQFFSLAAAVWPLAERHAGFRALLGKIHVSYADFLFGQNRHFECEPIATRAQDLLTGSRSADPDMTYVAIRGAGAAAESSGRQGARRAAETLRWALSFPADPTRKIWLLCELGHAYRRQGRAEEAARLGREAWQAAERVEHSGLREDSLHRILGLFVDTGQYREALEAASRIGRSLETYPFNAIRMAQVNLEWGDQSEAHTWLQRAYAVLDRPGSLPHYQIPYLPTFRRHADALSARL